MGEETTLQTARTCGTCGSALQADDRFCTDCGQDAATVSAPPAQAWRRVAETPQPVGQRKKNELPLPATVTMDHVHTVFKNRLAGRYRIKPDDLTSVAAKIAEKGVQFQVQSSFLTGVGVSIKHSDKAGRRLIFSPGVRWALAATTITTFLFMIISLIVMASGAWMGIVDILFFLLLILGFGVIIPMMSRPLARRVAGEAATWPEIATADYGRASGASSSPTNPR